MALERFDDLDGTAGAETVTFSLDGKRFEIDLCDENAAAFRGMFKPYLTKARPVEEASGVLVCLPARLSHSTGVLTLIEQGNLHAVGGGGGLLFSESDSTNHPVLKVAPGPAVSRLGEEPVVRVVPDEQASHPAQETPQPSATSAMDVRTWALRWGVPDVPRRGRMPEKIRAVYDAFQDGDKGPWKQMLKEHGIDPAKAESEARALAAVDSKKAAGPTQDELNRQAANKVGNLSPAQLTRLRRMFNARDGRAESKGTSGDTTSYEALLHRGCCIKIATDGRKATYEITDVGRYWFEVRGIDPAGT